jgi:anti-sigma regulatory factor (Ser/Thr protein kinase)
VTAAAPERFHHEALLYEGLDGFMGATLPFIRAGVAAEEPILVAVDEEKIGLLKGALGEDARAVEFREMRGLGRNPACIIPAWREFVVHNALEGRAMRGVGEPIWAGRDPAELDECHRHETLLNVAFDDGPPWTLVCPYDTAALPAEVIEHARCTHPRVGTHEVTETSHTYGHLHGDPLAGELPPPPDRPEEMSFTLRELGNLRGIVQAWARAAGLPDTQVADVVLAVNELASNSIRYGGGRGTLLSWREPGAFVCELRDSGRIGDPLVGRGLPGDPLGNGRGLWIVNQLCDLVRIRSHDSGCAVRLHFGIA